MKIAIVHDWLVTYAGAERVLEQLLLYYPDADLFSVIDFLPQKDRSFLQDKKPITTFIQRLPFSRKGYQKYFPLMPIAIEQLDLSGYDVILSSSHSVSKGVITGPDQLHISYIHSPMRYAWDLQHQYLEQAGLTKGIRSCIVRYLLHKMRIWDVRAALGVDQFIANSNYIARRIWKTYRREAKVIYPPVDVNSFEVQEDKEDFFVTVSRLVPYKRIDLIVDAFSRMPNKQLVVIGAGPEMKKIRKRVTPNVTLLGEQPFSVVRDYLRRAKCFVFAAIEDFGLAPVEAQACGTPVIAYGKGGCLETIKGLNQPSPTGLFFEEQTVKSLMEAVYRFDSIKHHIKSSDCRQNALRFSVDRFREEFLEFVNLGR